MKSVENNVKCGEIRIFDHKFYKKTVNFLSTFVPVVGILLQNFVAGLGFLNENLVPPRSALGRGSWLPVKVIPSYLITYY